MAESGEQQHETSVEGQSSSERSDLAGGGTPQSVALAKVSCLRPDDADALASIVTEHPSEARDIMAFAASHLGNRTVQRAFHLLGDPRTAVHSAEEQGAATPAMELPFADQIQKAFGPAHDISGIRAHVDPASTRAMGANAYAIGNDVVFGGPPDLHTAAHEAAHVVQQAGGVQLPDGVGRAGDSHERQANAVADRVVAGQPAGDLLGGSTDRGAQRGVQMDRSHDDHGDNAPHAAPERVGHEAFKTKIEWGHGSVTGAINLTAEYGTTGVPIGDEKSKLLKNTFSTKLNGFKTKLETALLNRKLEGEMLDGVKISFEENLLKLGNDGHKTNVDLMTFAVKLSGDVSHWAQLPKSMKVTIDGQLQIALGDKLLAEMAEYTAAKLEEQALVKEAETVGTAIETEATAIKELQRSQLAKGATAAEREVLEKTIGQHRLRGVAQRERLEALLGRLGQVGEKTQGALRGMKGWVSRQVAKQMEKRAVKVLTKVLGKLLPILNIASIMMDVYDVIMLIKALRDGHKGDGDGDGDGHGNGDDDRAHGGDGSGGHDSAHAAKPEKSGDVDGIDDATHGSSRHPVHGDQKPGVPSKFDPKELAEARAQLSPPGHRIVDSLTRARGAAGEFSADQLRVLAAVIPADLTQEDIEDVIAMLHSKGEAAASSEDALAAVERAVRAVRNRYETVTVDGVTRPDLAEGDNNAERSSVDGEGPITSPSQVDGHGRYPTGVSVADEAVIILRSAPPELIGQWFEVRNDQLVMNDVGESWIAAHSHTTIDGTQLSGVVAHIADSGTGHWQLQLVFNRTRNTAIRHEFTVHLGHHTRGLGARVGNLIFEPVNMLGKA